MFEEKFGGPSKAATPQQAKEKDFLTVAKEDHYALCQDFVGREQSEFKSFEDFMEQLGDALFELWDHTCRQSYKNGVKTGKKSQRKD